MLFNPVGLPKSNSNNDLIEKVKTRQENKHAHNNFVVPREVEVFAKKYEIPRFDSYHNITIRDTSLITHAKILAYVTYVCKYKKAS